MSNAQTYAPDDDALAAEYALHLLSPSARDDFERRMLDDAALRDLVRGWDEHFAALSDEFEAAQPPARIKSALQNRLFGEQHSGGLTKALARFLFGGGMVTAALGAAVFIVLPMLTDPVGFNPTHRAEVAAEDQSLIITAQFSAKEGAIVVKHIAGQPAPDRDHEMWLIPEGTSAPISLGVIPQTAQTRVEIPAELRGQLTAAIFAISDEPKGGSPTGQPTGAVLAAGPIQTL